MELYASVFSLQTVEISRSIEMFLFFELKGFFFVLGRNLRKGGNGYIAFTFELLSFLHNERERE